jgi:hypothetical protein
VDDTGACRDSTTPLETACRVKVAMLRKGIFVPVGVSAGAFQIVYRLLSIGGHVNGVLAPGFGHRALKEEHIVRIVFHLEYWVHNLCFA